MARPAPVPMEEFLAGGANRVRARSPAAPEPTAAARLVPYPVEDYSEKNLLEEDVELIRDFVEEAGEHLDASEGHLLVIEKDPHETEALNAVFRAFHTIKGLAGFIELEHIKDLAHKAENLLDMARRGELVLTGNNMDLVFESVDMMKRLIEGITAALGGDGRLSEEGRLPSLMARLVAATERNPSPRSPRRSRSPRRPAPAKPKKPGTGFIPLKNLKKTVAATQLHSRPRL